MGCAVVLIVAFLCMLQFDLYQAQNNEIFEMRIPVNSISNPPPYQKQNRVPYPYYPQFSNGCNSCQSSICKKRCTKTNQLNLGLSQNPVSISLPYGANGERTKIIIDNKSQSNCGTGKQTINVVVKVTPKSNSTTDGKSSVNTTANSTAIQTQKGEQLTADSSANENVKNSDSNVDVEVYVTDNNSGKTSEDTELESKIIAEDGQGDESESDTKSEIDNKPKNNSTEAPSGSNKPKPQNTISSDSNNSPKNITAASASDSSPDKTVPAAPGNGSPVTGDTSTPINKPDSEGEPSSPPKVENPASDDKQPSSASTSATSEAAAGNGDAVAASTTDGTTATINTGIPVVTTTVIGGVTSTASGPGTAKTAATGGTAAITTDTSGVSTTFGGATSLVTTPGLIASSATNVIGGAGPGQNFTTTTTSIPVSTSTTSAISPGDGGTVSGIITNDPNLASTTYTSGVTSVLNGKTDDSTNSDINMDAEKKTNSNVVNTGFTSSAIAEGDTASTNGASIIIKDISNTEIPVNNASARNSDLDNMGSTTTGTVGQAVATNVNPTGNDTSDDTDDSPLPVASNDSTDTIANSISDSIP